MTFITTVTQKGQVTLPKKVRDQFGIAPFSKIAIVTDSTTIRIEPTQDILDLAGTFHPKKGKSVLKAREAMEKKYQRI